VLGQVRCTKAAVPQESLQADPATREPDQQISSDERSKIPQLNATTQ
jgi:hypothetical protein